MSYRILVPRSLDATQTNPQTLNAIAMLQRWGGDDLSVDSFYYTAPDPIVAENPCVNLHKLWRWRFWRAHIFYRCQLKYDAIFYAGSDVADGYGLMMRDLFKRSIKAIVLVEGLKGNPERERIYSELAGHPVYCQYAEDYYINKWDWLINRCDAVIAISPFIGEMARKYYGEAISRKLYVLPLGIDSHIFHANNRKANDRFRVVGAGRLHDNKRPELFITLAERFPDVDFIWYGWGELHQTLLADIERRHLNNISFPGPVAPSCLAEAFRSSNLFILPSRSEGAPKVIQEATACGLPVICYGYYETPHVIDGENGFVVWSNDELFSRVEQLIDDPQEAHKMGRNGSQMAQEWDWDIIAPRWLKVVEGVVGGK